MSPCIKGPHHPPRMQLRCTVDKVEGLCAGEEGSPGNLHSISEDGPSGTLRVGRPSIVSHRVMEGASSP